MDPAPTETLSEGRRNALLRQRDWRFLLRRQEPLEPDEPLRIGFPSHRALAAAREGVPAGGELLCAWRLPRLRGVQRARRHLAEAGFTDLRLLWPGPLPHHRPQFWLPPDSPAAAEHLLATRPAGSLLQAALRVLWRIAARLGVLVPIFALARAPGTADSATEDDLAPYLPPDAPCLLLTGGRRSINKVVALPFPPGERRPSTVVKFSRLTEADRALEREAAALEAVERAHPGLAGTPRLLARGRRAGGFGVAETAIYGTPLIRDLTPQSFAPLAERVTEWLIELAAGGGAPSADWRERLVEAPLATFERDFGAVAGSMLARARNELAELPDLPQACEHRDCSPWNVVLDEGSEPALLDWESAEPRGLPGLDLAYFLANAAFVLDGALDSGTTRASYARLLDPTTPHGRIAVRCVDKYCARLHLSPEAFGRLRVLCWIVHSQSDHRHLVMERAAAPGTDALRRSTFLGLLEEELGRGE